MHLIQILLPLYDNEEHPLERALFDQVKEELTSKFGGLTAYVRSPAEGVNKHEGESVNDDIVVYEVMAHDLKDEWWKQYRETLEQRFRQDEIIVRALAMKLL